MGSLLREYQEERKQDRLREFGPSTGRAKPSRYVGIEEYMTTIKDLQKTNEYLMEEVKSLRRFSKDIKMPPVIAMPSQRSVNIPVPLDQGGTGADTYSQARLNLGIGTSANTINIGDPNTDGSWKFEITTTDLAAYRRESGAWVEKGRFQA